ncbi:hypothetical protein CR513_27827, partial [Mucuna pruriens]
MDQNMVEAANGEALMNNPYIWRICNDQIIYKVRDPVSAPLLSCSTRQRSLWIRSNSLEGPRLWAILAYYFLRHAYLRLDLRTMLEDRNGYKPKKRNGPTIDDFGVSKALISDQRSHFYNHTVATLLKKYGVVHQVATAYHPQNNDQAKVLNKKIKKLLQKMANPSQNDWSRLLEDALRTHRKHTGLR